MSSRIVVFSLVSLAVGLWSGAGPALAQSVLYVDADSPAPGDGSNWSQAFHTIEGALVWSGIFGPHDEIHVAEGTYYPTAPGGRSATIRLRSGLALMGGYAGCGEPDPNARDVDVYVTIISGDIGAGGNISDNCYHVVTGDGVGASAVLDGFTITGGNADEDCCTNDRGAGMRNSGGGPTIRNCRFVANSAGRGAGMFNNYSNPSITDCVFMDNFAEVGGGGAMLNISSQPLLDNCTFAGNVAPAGAGVYNYDSSPAILDCTFAGNSATHGGGVYNFNHSNPLMTDCVFSGNSAMIGGGVVGYISDNSTIVTRCVFAGNYATSSGGAMMTSSANPRIASCLFAGNGSGVLGGALYNSSAVMDNTTPASAITNCSFSLNFSGAFGGAMTNLNCSPVLTNCILWNDFPNEFLSQIEDSVLSYCDVQGGADGDGNIAEDPLFAAGETGTWTAAGAYDAQTHLVVLTDAGASWTDGELVGKFLNPDTSQGLVFPIIANTDTEITIRADWDAIDAGASWVPDGAGFEIQDFHLATGSPCIGAGDPGYTVDPATPRDIDGETRIMGGRVDMGADEFTVRRARLLNRPARELRRGVRPTIH
jgi:hypothetical protein